MSRVFDPEAVKGDAKPYGASIRGDYFDYLLSWNACYYMEDETSLIGNHVSEYARVLKRAVIWLPPSLLPTVSLCKTPMILEIIRFG